jgi:hypothetical protein
VPLDDRDFLLTFLWNLIQTRAKRGEVSLQLLHILFAEVERQLDSSVHDIRHRYAGNPVWSLKI